MKIGILTQPLSANYGGILQNYALQQVIKRMGYDVATIDVGKPSWLTWFDNAWRVAIHRVLGRKYQFRTIPPRVKAQQVPLRRFVKQNITITTPRSRWYNKRLVERNSFEVLIVGSDQVWRPKYNQNIYDLFLSFIGDMNIKRIAYAASFGTDCWEYEENQTEICSQLAKKFNAISVREASAVRLCNEYLGVTAQHVLDPSLLLTSDDYESLCSSIKKRDNFVFAYILNKDKEKISLIEKIAESRRLPLIIKSSDDELLPTDSIETWLSMFRDASFVVTDSFHGTAFSINFRKDFYVFKNQTRGNDRFESLLTLFDLKSRIITDVIPTDREIDWDSVSMKLNAERSRSMKWLNDALEVD